MAHASEGLGKRTILIVDDSPVVRDFLCRLLGQRGYETEVATNGVAALQRLDSTPFDLVITDVYMPEMDGLTFLDKVKLRAPDIPVVLLTAWPSAEDTVHALRVGAREVLTKPISPREFLHIVDGLCTGLCVLPVHALGILYS